MRYLVLGMLVLFALGDACSPSPGVVGVQDYGQVTGRVLDAMTNDPIPNALVAVGSLYTTNADPRGGFTLQRVPIGDQTVVARAPGYTTASADVTVKKDRGVSVGYIRLVPTIHPEGRPTLSPPATPAPPSPSPAASVTPAESATPAAPAAPASPASAAPSAAPSPAVSPAASAMPSASPTPAATP